MKHYILFTSEWIASEYYDNDMSIRKAYPPEYIEENSTDMTLAVADSDQMQVHHFGSLLAIAQMCETHLFLDEDEYDYLSEYL
jgi:hypothetical protein